MQESDEPMFISVLSTQSGSRDAARNMCEKLVDSVLADLTAKAAAESQKYLTYSFVQPAMIPGTQARDFLHKNKISENLNYFGVQTPTKLIL